MLCYGFLHHYNYVDTHVNYLTQYSSNHQLVTKPSLRLMFAGDCPGLEVAVGMVTCS